MLLADYPQPRRPRMLGDLPPLTNGLHEPEPTIVSVERTNLGEANATLPPVSRVLPPLRGAPRISSSLSQPEVEPSEPTEGDLKRPQDAGDLQSVSSAADLQTQATGSERSADTSIVVSEDGGACSPLTRLFSRFRKDRPVTHEPVTPEAPEEPKEEPDDESRPERQALRAGLPAEDSPAARPGTPAVSDEPDEPEQTQTQQTTADSTQSKTCSIL